MKRVTAFHGRARLVEQDPPPPPIVPLAARPIPGSRQRGKHNGLFVGYFVLLIVYWNLSWLPSRSRNIDDWHVNPAFVGNNRTSSSSSLASAIFSTRASNEEDARITSSSGSSQPFIPPLNSAKDAFSRSKLQQQEAKLLHTLESIQPNVPRRIDHVLGAPVLPENATDLVLVTHASVAKLDKIKIQLEHWRGPASIAVYMTSRSDISNFFQWIQQTTLSLEKITFHAVVEHSKIQKNNYPHNILRNLAMKHARALYFLALDADHIPGPSNTYEHLSKLLFFTNTTVPLAESILRQEKRLLVLPAWEVLPPSGQSHATVDRLPRTKDDIRLRHAHGSMRIFDQDTFPPGHKPTNFARWLNVNKKDEVWYPIDYYRFFEPYVVGYRPGIPKYWPFFRGFGYNKVCWFAELNAAGYRFGVLQDFWVAHLNHPEPTGTQVVESKKKNLAAYVRFVQYLNRTYGKYDY